MPLGIKMFRNKYGNIHIMQGDYECLATKNKGHYKTGLEFMDKKMLFQCLIQEFLHDEKISDDLRCSLAIGDLLDDTEVFLESDFRIAKIDTYDVRYTQEFVKSYN
jgi:hypothetical protein